MVQQYDSDFDAELMGRKGPPFWGFGKGRPPIGKYIEGTVVDKQSVPSTKFQNDAQRERREEREYEYWVGKKLKYSTKALDQYLLEEPTARPNKNFNLTLQTALRDPEKGDRDDGRRVFTLPRDAKGKLADALRNQGMDGGLPLGAFVRITLERLEQLPDLETPKRHYKVEVWDSGEQPSPSPAQPVVEQPVQQATAAQQQPVYQAPVQQAAFPQYPDNMLAMLKQQGQPCPPGNEDVWARL